MALTPPKDRLAGHQQRLIPTGIGIGGGEGTAEEVPPAGRVTYETDYLRFADDTEMAGSAERTNSAECGG
jgi:hypothetical protein